MFRAVLALFACALAAAAQAPTWQPQTAATRASLRGLAVVSPAVVWASGTGGTVLRTLDAGAHWQVIQVPGAEKLDLRDIKAFNDKVAWAAAIDQHGGIFKTEDGGAHWTEQTSATALGIASGFFLDGIAFRDPRHGFAVGDPLDGHFLLLATRDGGQHWTRLPTAPAALPGEGVFAASGTSLIVTHDGTIAVAAGGAGARVLLSHDAGRTWTASAVAMGAPGKSGAGVFSLAFDGPHAVAVGGDYTAPRDATATGAWSKDAGATWALAQAPPSGYRSAVAFVPASHGRDLIAVGPSGGDVSHDGGHTWSPLPGPSLNAVAVARDGSVFAVGGRGAIVHLSLP